MPTLTTFGAAAARALGETAVSLVPISITISSNTVNYTLSTAQAPGYVAGRSFVTLTIDSGVFVSSATTGSYALSVDNSWSPGDVLKIVNSGTVLGRGGNGGTGGNSSVPGQAGQPGGPSLYVNYPTRIDNAPGRIAGGGDGGSGAGSPSSNTSGGGGGGGIGVSTGGGVINSQQGGGLGQPGQPGTLLAAGNGGTGGAVYWGTKASFFGNPGGPGGSYGGGSAVVGNSKVTWLANGTINGAQTG